MIHINVGMLVYWFVYKKYICQYTWSKHAHAQSQFGTVTTDLWHPSYSFRLYGRAALVSMDEKEAEKNVHLEMRNLKQTELQRLKNRGKKG